MVVLITKNKNRSFIFILYFYKIFKNEKHRDTEIFSLVPFTWVVVKFNRVMLSEEFNYENCCLDEFTDTLYVITKGKKIFSFNVKDESSQECEVI